MKMLKKILCLTMALLLTFSLFGCGEKDSNPSDEVIEKPSYIGTWKGSDHDGKEVVHYLIFDDDGYWNVYLNYKSLTKAIKQLPEQLVSFKIFRKIQNSGQTGCHFEYVKNDEGSHYEDVFSFNDEGKLVMQNAENVQYVLLSDYVGEPDEAMVEECRDLFDRARTEALLKE